MKNKFSFWAKILPLVVLITVTLNMALNCDEAPVLSPARLEIAPAELNFGENDNSLAFAIKNTGQQNLTWTVSESVDWIVNFQSTSGKIVGTNESQITVTIDRERLEQGEWNRATIQVTAAADDGGQLEGGAKNVTVLACGGTCVSSSGTNTLGVLVLTDITVSENQPIGTEIGILSVEGDDEVNTYTYSLVFGTGDTDNSHFSIEGNRLKAAAVFDYETKNSYSIRIQGKDENEGMLAQKFFTIQIKNLNESPTDIAITNTTILEKQAENTLIGTLTTIGDNDIGDTHNYTLLSHQDSFIITDNQLMGNAVFDYDSKNSYTIQIRTDDGKGGTFDKNFTITINHISGWLLATSSTGWAERIDHTSVIFNNKMWVLGGLFYDDVTSTASRYNDVWCSSDGIDWEQIDASADWSERSVHTSVVFNDRMYVLGGYDGSAKNDVWYSGNGSHWVEVSSAAPWEARYNHTSNIFSNKILVIGGVGRNPSGPGVAPTFADVWTTSGHGSYSQNYDNAWPARDEHTSVVFNGRLWVIGGNNFSDLPNLTYSDVWSTDGINSTWTQETSSTPWPTRTLEASVVYNNKIWVLGNDYIYSSSDGVNWVEEATSVPWGSRSGFTSVVFDNKIWVIGGAKSNFNYLNDVWYYEE